MSAQETLRELEKLIERYDLSDTCSSELRKLVYNNDEDDWAADYTPTVSLDDPYSTDEVSIPSGSMFISKKLHQENIRIGRYIDLGLLGKGGVGEVHLVYDDRLNRKIALKLIHKHLQDDKISLLRFVEEGQIAGQLQHPNIISVYEIGQLRDGRPFFTMEVIRGTSLKRIISTYHEQLQSQNDGEWNLYRLMSIFLQACKAIAYAHKKGVIHRDIKPANIMISDQDESLVVDWGLAKVVNSEGDEGLTTKRDEYDDSVTEIGSVEGTPSYMAPEQASGDLHNADARTDVYALGAVLYEILSGSPPYGSGSPYQILRKVLLGPPAPLNPQLNAVDISTPHIEAGRSMPYELVRICEKAMQRKADDRYADATEMLVPIRMWLDGSERRERAGLSVQQATEIQRDIARLKGRAKANRIDFDHIMQRTFLWEKENRKIAAWELEDKAQFLEKRARRRELELEQALRTALVEMPGFVEANLRLAELYKNRLDDAERNGDTSRAMEAEMSLSYHVGELPLNHPELRKYLSYLKGRGAVTIRTDVPQAEVHLHKYLLKNRRLIQAPLDVIGRTPLVQHPLDMGSYLLQLKAPGRKEVYYPLMIERQRHWTGRRPKGTNPQKIHLPLENELGDDDCYVPSGWFWFGGDPNALNALEKIRIWQDAFVIKQYPVTNREYLDFLNSLVQKGREAEALRHVPRERGGSDLNNMVYGRTAKGSFYLKPDVDGDLWELDWPVIMIDWNSAMAYCMWYSEKMGVPWRLPFEGEWEKAARGVDGRIFPWGNDFDPSWCSMRESHNERPILVNGSDFLTDCSPYKAYSMAGNVREWTNSVWRKNGPKVIDRRLIEDIPTLAPGLRVTIKGGAWYDPEIFCRAASRICAGVNRKDDVIGFRLARSYLDGQGKSLKNRAERLLRNMSKSSNA